MNPFDARHQALTRDLPSVKEIAALNEPYMADAFSTNQNQ